MPPGHCVFKSSTSVTKTKTRLIQPFFFQTPCSENPCLNGGTCIALYHLDEFKCSCPPGFKGKTCDIGESSTAAWSLMAQIKLNTYTALHFTNSTLLHYPHPALLYFALLFPLLSFDSLSSTLFFFILPYTTLSYPTLVLLYSTLLYSTLLYSTPLYSTLLYSTLLCSALLCSTLLSTLPYPTLLYSTLLSTLLYSVLYSTLLYSTLLYSTLLYFCYDGLSFPLVAPNYFRFSLDVRPFAVPADCTDLQQSDVTTSGVYTIDPDGKGAFQVYCDMATDGGGWAVFQRRQDGFQDFYLSWSEYKAGFGQLTGEFWLGLDKIHRLTASRPSELRVEIVDWSGGSVYAKYGSFGVGDEQSLYVLSVGSYSGTAGDSLTYHSTMKFSTKGRDHDQHGSAHCAVSMTGAWWYNHCQYSNLNGQYLGNIEDAKGVNWYYYKTNRLSMKFAEMKLRPTN